MPHFLVPVIIGLKSHEQQKFAVQIGSLGPFFFVFFPIIFNVKEIQRTDVKEYSKLEIM